MPKYYLLEVMQAQATRPLAEFRSENPFGGIAKGESISLIGADGKLDKRHIVAVEHTIWVDKKDPVHKTVILTA